MLPASSRRAAAPFLAAAAVAAVTAALAAPAAAAPAAPSPTTAAAKVVVVLRNQLPSTPAGRTHAARRAVAAATTQNTVLGHLPGTAARRVKHFSLGNAFSATVTPAQAAELAADPAVAAVVPDITIPLTGPTAPIKAKRITAPANAASRDGLTSDPGAVCPSDPSTPLLEPEGLRLIHAASADGSPSAADLATGQGVKVGVLADGVDESVPDFVRPDGDNVIVDQADFTGVVPPLAVGEASGDISTIAAQGTVHDLHDASASIPAGCTVKIVGVAPGSQIVALSGIGATSPLSAMLEAIDYATNVAHVDVLNESFGLNTVPDAGARAAIQLFDEAAVRAGVTVVASSGDAGTTGTIGSPASDPGIISVGATTSLRLFAQTGANGTDGTWADDNIAEFSSSGFTNAGTTISLVAPGFEGWDAQAGAPGGIAPFGGTSESAPYVAGTAALVIQAYRQTHKGASPSPALVKSLLTGTADDLGADAQDQGAGLLNARSAVEAALTYPTAKSAPSVPSHLVTSDDQLNFSGKPGSTQKATETVTNVGTKAITVAPSVRQFAPASTQTINVTADGSSATAVPFDVRGTNGTCAQVKVRVHNSSIAFGSGKIELLDPHGTLQNLSAPQGIPYYSLLGSTQCTPGSWTVVLPAQLHGAVTIKADTFIDQPVGTVTPAGFTLAGGASRTVTVKAPVPANGGDYGYALLLATSTGRTSTVPITMRSVLPLTDGGASFGGTFTGGNGRGGLLATALSVSYSIDVAAGRPALQVTTTVHPPVDSSADFVEGYLVDPNGEVVSTSNAGDVYGALGIGLPQQDVGADGVMSLTAQEPQAGRWTLVLDEAGAAESIGQPFTGKVSTSPGITATSGALPTSAATTLAAGLPVEVPVTVTNTTGADMKILADPRTTSLRTFQAVPTVQGTSPGSAQVTIPGSSPSFGVPTGTRSLTVTSTSSRPTIIDALSPNHGISVVGSLPSAQAGSTVSTASVHETSSTLSPGVWLTEDGLVGPFTSTAAPAAARVTASIRTLGFDRSMVASSADTSGIGVDPYLGWVDPDSSLLQWAYFGAHLAPKASITFTMTITPAGKVGKVVDGTLNVVTDGGSTTLAALPYRYTIGPAATTP